MATFSRIVFLQGDDANEFFKIPSHKIDERLQYLKQWDYGDDYDMHDKSAAGPYDDFHYFEPSQDSEWLYLMTWSSYRGYAGLERVIG